MNLKDYLSITPEVSAALRDGKPVVALESTILSHGMPYPENLAFAAEIEKIIRAEGAVLRVGSRYYPADAVTPPDAQPAAVLAFLRENGPGARKAIAARLGLPPAQTAALLHRMAAEGRLLLTGKRYALPTDSPD